jgi:hypothetical protein
LETGNSGPIVSEQESPSPFNFSEQIDSHSSRQNSEQPKLKKPLLENQNFNPQQDQIQKEVIENNQGQETQMPPTVYPEKRIDFVFSQEEITTKGKEVVPSKEPTKEPVKESNLENKPNKDVEAVKVDLKSKPINKSSSVQNNSVNADRLNQGQKFSNTNSKTGSEQKKKEPKKTPPTVNKAKGEAPSAPPLYLATISIFLSNRTENAGKVNEILTDFGSFFLGRIGLPLTRKCVERCSTLIILAAEIDEGNLKKLTQKISSLEGALAKPLIVKRLG